jgi:hypothetical protein
MREQEFDQRMEAWAEHETQSGPELRPTADMYRLVEAKKKASFWSVFMSRRAVLATAVASLVLLITAYVGLYDPFSLFHPLPSEGIIVVAMRQGFPSEKGPVVQPTAVPSRKMPKGQTAFFEQLLFQFQNPDSRTVVSVDVRAPREEAIALTSADNYRLVWQPAINIHVYAFQLTSSGILARLFPSGAYTSTRNPLRQGQMYYLPAEPNWFYLDESPGEERLYIVASTKQLLDLEEMYAQYPRTEDTRQKEELLSKLLKALEIIAQADSNEVAGWMFPFQHY